MYNELAVLRKETRRLQLSMRRYTGEDMSSIPFEELDQLEQELEHSVNKVRERKVLFIIFQFPLIHISYSSPLLLIQNQPFCKYLTEHECPESICDQNSKKFKSSNCLFLRFFLRTNSLVAFYIILPHFLFFICLAGFWNTAE